MTVANATAFAAPRHLCGSRVILARIIREAS